MKLFINSLLAKFAPELFKPVRIDPNHLPGLTPPTVAPFRPTTSKPKDIPEPDYRGMYKNFKKSESSKKIGKRKKGFDS